MSVCSQEMGGFKKKLEMLHQVLSDWEGLKMEVKKGVASRLGVLIEKQGKKRAIFSLHFGSFLYCKDTL